MRIEKIYSEVALQLTDNKRKALSVEFVSRDLDEYRAALKAVAKKGRYTEGKKIFDRDVTLIKENFEKLLCGMTENFAKRSEGFKLGVDVAEYVMAAHDYLFAFTENELNCPEIQSFRYDDIRNLFTDAAMDINKAKLGNELLTSECFKAQRGKNADELKDGNLGELLEKVSGRTPSPEEIGALLAERQALEMRQQNHGAVWRFFHRKENASRTALLRDMEEALRGKIPTNMISMDTDPKDVVNYKVADSFRRDMLKREARPAEAYGYNVYKENPRLLEEFTATREVSQNPIEKKTLDKDRLSIPLNGDLAVSSKNIDVPAKKKDLPNRDLPLRK